MAVFLLVIMSRIVFKSMNVFIATYYLVLNWLFLNT